MVAGCVGIRRLAVADKTELRPDLGIQAALDRQYVAQGLTSGPGQDEGQRWRCGRQRCRHRRVGRPAEIIRRRARLRPDDESRYESEYQ